MSASLSRRSFTAGSIATLLAGSAAYSLPRGTLAAQAGDDLASLGLPALDITVDADGFGGAPTELEAGRYLLSVTLGEGVEAGAASFVRPPEELSADQFLTEIETTTDFADEDEAIQASPGAEIRPAGVPLVAYDATFAGGAVVGPGMSGPSQAVIDLPPGEWVLWAGSPDAPQVPLIFSVTGEMPGDLPEPEADLDVVLTDEEVTVEGALTAGEHLLRLEHQGEEPHHIELRKGPDSMTEEQVGQVVSVEAGDEEGAADLPFDPETDMQTVLLTADVSAGAVIWVPVTLEAGTYAALCFFPAKEDARPHALNGQYTLFTVK